MWVFCKKISIKSLKIHSINSPHILITDLTQSFKYQNVASHADTRKLVILEGENFLGWAKRLMRDLCSIGAVSYSYQKRAAFLFYELLHAPLNNLTKLAHYYCRAVGTGGSGVGGNHGPLDLGRYANPFRIKGAD